jgi:hypothetical protein
MRLEIVGINQPGPIPQMASAANGKREDIERISLRCEHTHQFALKRTKRLSLENPLQHVEKISTVGQQTYERRPDSSFRFFPREKPSATV